MFSDPAGFFENHPDAMLVVDPLTDVIVAANLEAKKLFGCGADELTSKTLESIGLQARNSPGEKDKPQYEFVNKPFFDVQLQDVQFDGRQATLVSLRDCAHLIEREIGRVGIANDFGPETEGQTQNHVLNQRLREVVDGMSDIFVVLDWKANFTYVNASAEILLNRSREQLLGRNIWEEFPESIGSPFYDQYVKALETKENTHFVEYSNLLNRLFSIMAYPTSEGVAVLSRDVTEQRARDQQLNLLETAVSKINDIVHIFKVDPNDKPEGAKIIFANDAFVRRTGYDLNEVIGKTPQFLEGPDTQRSEMERIAQAMRDSQAVRSEFINYSKSGEPYWIEMEKVPIKNAKGVVTHWVAVERDITERKIAAERVAVSEERFQLIAEATKVVIWDCDLEEKSIWWNKNLYDVFGHKPRKFDQWLTWWDENLHPDDKETAQEEMQSIVEGQDTVWELNYRFRKADGSFSHVVDKGSIIRDHAGKAIRILGGMSDVSEEVRLNEQLRQAQKLEAVGHLTGGVAHDFNNLLAIILGNLELLQFELDDQKVNKKGVLKLIEAGKNAVMRGADLSNSMLAYARKSRLEPEDMDLNKIVLETETWMRRTIESNIAIKTQLQENLWKVRVDPNSLQNAIVNLLVNSRDALGDGGQLTISTKNIYNKAGDRPQLKGDMPNGDCVVLEVTDNGVGMDQATLDQIFTPFFTTKPVGQGSGLGLSMVQGFVKQSGGSILVSSKPGYGTSVKLIFMANADKAPIEGVTEEHDVTRTQNEYDSAADGCRILIAEDEPEVMAVLQKILEGEGYDITTAASGDQGFAIFKDDMSFDLILTDIMMPGNLQGGGLADACRELCPEIPVIFLSGYASKMDILGDGEQSGDIRLMKPISRRDLLAAIKRSLSSPTPRARSQG